MQKAIFLDRDGTINEDVDFLTDIKDLRLLPGAYDALSILKDLGYINIIITNQSGIARGYLTEENLTLIHKKLISLLTVEDLPLIDDVFYAPTLPDAIMEKYKSDSEDRKPGIGMIIKAAKKHNINLGESFLIGDSYPDMKCAENAGLKSIFVLSGKGEKDLERCKAGNINIFHVCNTLFDAANFIKSI